MSHPPLTGDRMVANMSQEPLTGDRRRQCRLRLSPTGGGQRSISPQVLTKAWRPPLQCRQWSVHCFGDSNTCGIRNAVRYIVASKRGSRKLGMQKCLAQDNNAWYLVRTLHYALCLFHASTNASRKIRTLSSQTHGIYYMEALCTHAKKCLLTFTKAQSTFSGKL